MRTIAMIPESTNVRYLFIKMDLVMDYSITLHLAAITMELPL